MSVTEIQAAITELTSDDLADLMNWLDDYQAKLWDKEIDEDLQAGRLEKVLAEVDKEGYATGYWERGRPRPQ
jgi:DNA-binding PadR family transcriptional regulator